MTNEIYHTSIRPVDGSGQELKPLDLVILGDIPEHYWSDSPTLKEYAGAYGLVTYHPSLDGVGHDPFYNRNKNHPGWVNSTGEVVFVESHRIKKDEEAIYSCEFWLPSASLTRIPFNSLIMNIFVEYPWQMGDVDGPSDYMFIRSGIPEYEYIKKIMCTPYQKLVDAHNAAMALI